MTTKQAQIKNPVIEVVDVVCAGCFEARGVYPSQVKTPYYCPSCQGKRLMRGGRKDYHKIFNGLRLRICDLPEGV